MATALLKKRIRNEGRGSAPSSGFRPDIQGLRAIAVGVVLLYHAHAPFLPGGFVGVDVFFVISGFLITGLLLKEMTATGGISLVGFYARRAKRILPAATIVLLTVAALTYIVLPRTRWDDAASHIFASAFNVVNWTFAGSAINYLDGDDAASPVQHFWTLAVEEQFYIVWPLLLAGAIYLSRKGRRAAIERRMGKVNPERLARLTRTAVVILTFPSLFWSVYYTSASPGAAYFVTTTRAWELGIGALLAVFAGSFLMIPVRVATILSWSGLAAILGSAALYSPNTPFPGYAALLPTLGAAAVIVGGMNGLSTSGAGTLLSTKGFTWVGNISYSLYLWHWPLIVIGTYLLGGLEFYQGIIIVALSVVPAYVSYRFVEQPVLNSASLKESPGVMLQVGTIMIIVSALAAVMILLIPKPVSTAGFVPGRPLADTSENIPVAVTGAAKLEKDPTAGQVKDTVSDFQPTSLAAATDNPAVYDLGCHQTSEETEAESCVFGNEESEFTIALVGDSHAAQWVPALTTVAMNNKWRMESYTKSACPLTTATMPGETGAYEACKEWNTNVLSTLTGPSRADFVLVTSSAYNAISPQSSAEGLAAAWGELRNAGVPFAVIADTPRPGLNVPECVSANPRNLSKCAVEKSVADENGFQDQQKAADILGDVPLINLNKLICPESHCPAIVGEVLVYRDTNHLTATYSSSLSGAFERELKAFQLPFAPAATPSPSH